MEIDKNKLISIYSKALESNTASMFIGAGLSVDSGYVDWVNLLKHPAKDIELEVEKEKYDLPTLAQYYVNRNKRAKLEEHILENYSVLKTPKQNHEIISKLPLQSIWTTNYDRLIETAYLNEGKVCDVKFDDKHLKRFVTGKDVVLYKMHGDIQTVEQIIITRDDYQSYEKNHELFREVLEGELVSKTFLFVGFGFNDPNLNNVLSRLRILLDDKPREHLCIMRRVSVDDSNELGLDINYLRRKQELQIEDLSRFGINICLINEYHELTEILTEILNIIRRRTIFISGAAYDYSPFSREHGIYFITSLSNRLLKSRRGYRVINGFGNGVGEYVLNGALENLDSTKRKKMLDQLVLLPFPLSLGKEKAETYRKYRESMIQQSGISLFLFGNKFEDGKIVDSNGMYQEYMVAQKFGSLPLPIEVTGFMAKSIYDDAILNFNSFTSDTNYIKLLKECSLDTTLSITNKADINKLITKIIKVIDSLNNHESEE